MAAEPTGWEGRGHVLDRTSTERPRPIRCSHAVGEGRRCHSHETLQSTRETADPAPDPLRRGNIALLAVLEGLPDATVGADARRPDRVRQRARRGAVRLRPRGAARPADRDAVARARARALQAQPRPLLRARAPAALHRARLRAAQGRQRVRRRDELGHRRQRRGPAAAGHRPQHLRPARDRAAAAPAVRAAGRGRRARRARAARASRRPS